MPNIIEDYVSFETAKLLKEKGFQQLQNDSGYFTTEMVYGINVDKNGEHHFAHQYPIGVYNKDKYIAAPTLQMTMKWLREVHNIHITIDYSAFLYGTHPYYWSIYKMDTIPRVNTQIETSTNTHDYSFVHYETACEAAIKYCLENLI